MKSTTLPIGSYVRIDKGDLTLLIGSLQHLGYRTIGPRVLDGAVVYREVDSAQDLPIGLVDEQQGGRYRLESHTTQAYFDFVVGPNSLKAFLFPARDVILECRREGNGNGWRMQVPDAPVAPLAVIGPRSCDLHALRIQDRVFLESGYVDPAYQKRRDNLFIAAINCRRAAATCFCHSMKTGPAVTFGYDLLLTELDEQFVIEVGTEMGGEVVTATAWQPCSIHDIEEARALSRNLLRELKERESRADDTPGQTGRFLNTSDIRDLLMDNLEHPRWEEVAHRCLSCGNCTMVCPTCFCCSVVEVSDLTGDHVHRERKWDSCFTAEHSYMTSGTVRKSTRSRYRQWLTHKLATWHDQFGTSGCTGCGRCITWCPVGIDLTEEVAAIREGSQHAERKV